LAKRVEAPQAAEAHRHNRAHDDGSGNASLLAPVPDCIQRNVPLQNGSSVSQQPAKNVYPCLLRTLSQ
jgi:hypothetical protein